MPELLEAFERRTVRCAVDQLYDDIRKNPAILDDIDVILNVGMQILLIPAETTGQMRQSLPL